VESRTVEMCNVVNEAEGINRGRESTNSAFEHSSLVEWGIRKKRHFGENGKHYSALMSTGASQLVENTPQKVELKEREAVAKVNTVNSFFSVFSLS
jgi:hypothetical protein